MAALGALRLGPVMVHRARGLFSRWQRLGLFDLRQGAREGIPLGEDGRGCATYPLLHRLRGSLLGIDTSNQRPVYPQLYLAALRFDFTS